MIEAGKEQWALATKQLPNADADDAANKPEVMKYIKNPAAATNCPGGGTVTFNVVGTNAACSLGYPTVTTKGIPGSHELSD